MISQTAPASKFKPTLPMFDLREIVEAHVETDGAMRWVPAVIIGRAFSGDPRYDVRLADDRMIGNLPQSKIRRVRQEN